MASNPNVIVIGAGLSGLCLAQGLRQAGIGVDVFEREASPSTRGQRYRVIVDLLGNRALKACLPQRLYDLMTATSGTLGDRFTIYDQNMRVLRQIDLPHASGAADVDVSRQIDRLTMRQILLGGLTDVIHFGKDFSRYSASGTFVTAHFADGTRATGTLLVGADGIDSRVRRQFLPRAAVRDTGAAAIFGRTPLRIDGEQVLGDEMVANDVLVVAPGQHALLLTSIRFREAAETAAARLAPDVSLPPREDYVIWALVFPADERESIRNHNGGATLKDLAVGYAEMFPATLARIVERGDPAETMLASIRAASPVGPWRPGLVTLMGDAIHATPPFGARGASAALEDAASLVTHLEAVARGDQDLLTAVSAYEETMLEYGFEAVSAAEAELRQPLGA